MKNWQYNFRVFPRMVPRFSASRDAIATLTTIMALVILLVAVAVGISFLSYTENATSANQNNSAQALEYADAGARDALQRLARNRIYNCPASTTSCYTIDFSANGTGCAASSACASISVSAANGSAATPKTITSTGQVGSDVRTIQVRVIYDSSLNGWIATTTWTEVTQ